MPSIIDRVRAALKRPNPTSMQLADVLVDARRADAEARAVVDKARAIVAAGFMDAADKRQADRDALAKARDAAEDAGLVLGEAERRRAEAVAADEEAARRAVYDGARAQADAAALALSETYRKLAAGMVAMLRDLAIAQQAVAQANADLPAGAEPITDPETATRGVPSLPREVVSEVEVELWTRYGNFTPIPDHDQDGIRDDGNGWGRHEGAHAPHFRRRRYIKRTVRPAVYAVDPIPLAAMIQLPAIVGDGFLWEAADPCRAVSLDAADVLARFAEIKRAASAQIPRPSRAVKVEWQDLGEVTTQGLKALPSVA